MIAYLIAKSSGGTVSYLVQAGQWTDDKVKAAWTSDEDLAACDVTSWNDYFTRIGSDDYAFIETISEPEEDK